MVGTVVKSMLGELEEEARGGFPRRLRKELTGVVQVVSNKRRLLVRFQYGWEKDLAANKFTVMAVDKIPVDEKPKVPTIAVMPDETVDSEKEYYHSVHVLLYFNK